MPFDYLSEPRTYPIPSLQALSGEPQLSKTSCIPVSIKNCDTVLSLGANNRSCLSPSMYTL